MPKYFNLSDYDVIFLSYDEPNADENFQQLLKKIPKAKRIHGIKGSDSAHKECAKISETERLIIIDGDNWLYGDLLNQSIELDDIIDSNEIVFSWPARNNINGLEYGNGGIKCWPKHVIENMQTHENCTNNNSRSKIDFCWEINYLAIDQCYSVVVNNATKLQAWRAGFREGVKLSLDRGSRVKNLNDIEKNNLDRLKIWMTIGLDVENGLWAILGARQGCHLTQFTDWDFNQIQNFDWLDLFYKENIEKLTVKEAEKNILKLGGIISKQITIPILFSKDGSEFFKTFNFNQKRQIDKIRNFKNHRYDIVMITYNEPNAEENYANLLKRFPHAKRVDNVKGIHQAHIEAAKLSNTEMFWVVDGDASVVEEFKFDYYGDCDDCVRVWRCKNPVNGLIYGYGGIKLLPKELTLNMDITKPDMTTSISEKYLPVNELSNITNFNTDPFSAWKSAFRECCKLSSKVIDRQKNSETNKRLKAWCTKGKSKKFGEFVIAGANAGKEYGEKNFKNKEALSKINDFKWLKQKFKEIYNDIK